MLAATESFCLCSLFNRKDRMLSSSNLNWPPFLHIRFEAASKFS